MAFYYCRLVPPRLDFALAMNGQEREIMSRHADDLRSLGETALVFGPVIDPAGIRGLAEIEAEDDAGLKRLLGADLSVASGLGFRYDTLPMMTAARGIAAVQP